MTGYNYDAFSPDNYNLQSADGPDIGDKAPDFELETHDGRKQRLLEFDGECLVLELGSMTCPLFLTRQDSMEKIAQDYPQVTSAFKPAKPWVVISTARRAGKDFALGFPSLVWNVLIKNNIRTLLKRI